MAEMELPELDTSQDDKAAADYQERGIDIEGLDEKKLKMAKERTPDTISQFSQMSTDEPDGRSTGKKKKKTKIIRDGLLLSLKGQKRAFSSYSYALTPLWDSPSRVDWRVLTMDSLECMHMYVHQLVPGDTLQSVANKHKNSCTDAIILINVDDSYSIPPVYCEKTTAQKFKKNSLPMILITAEDGVDVRELLNQYDMGELLAKIESKSQAHVEKTEGVAGGLPELPKIPKKPTGFRASMRKLTKGNQNLKEDVKSLMFPLSGPATVSMDEGLFQSVMGVFYQHEQTVLRKDGRHEDRGAIFRKFSKHLDDQFPKDFPFYLLVAYRVYKKENIYQCDEMSTFVRSCVDKYEKLEPTLICSTLENFFKMDNFKIMFSSTDELTVFKLMEQACIELMKLSFQYKSQEGNQASYRSVYCRMLWISVAYKCCDHRGVSSKDIPNYWQDHLITAESFTHLGTDTIQSIKRGVEFGRLLQLPDEVSFSSQHMGDVLTANNTIRPFQRMREFVIILEPFVQLEGEFIDCFMSHPRTIIYEPLFAANDKIWVKSFNSDGNLLAVLQEGIGFLDTVVEVGRKRQWLSDSMEEEIKAWLSSMLFTVDITNEKAESYLKTFLSSKMGSVTKLYSEHIKRAVIVKVQENFNILTVEQFHRLYKAFLIWPTWVVEKYLKQYKLPPEVKICSPTWNEFFSEFVDRFKDSNHHKFLLDFIKSVSTCYVEQERARDFILDLLALDVPDLFQMDVGDGSTSSAQSDILASSVSDDFTAFLMEYIQKYQLQEPLLEATEKIWNQITENNNFQQIVLLVLQQELIPETLTQQMTSSLRLLLDKCVKSICQNLDSLNSPSSRLEFCWGVVGSCCVKMPVTESLEWAKVYYHIIDHLGKIYSVYTQCQAGEDTRSVLDGDTMPHEITSSSCDGVKKFFEWLSRAQQVLRMWREKFTSKKVNYDSIKLYLDVYGLLNRAATSLSAGTLIVDANYVHSIKTDFEQAYELLNITMLRYISGHPDAGYLSLCEMLTKYGVGLPNETLMTIKKHVSFPGESRSSNKKAASMEYSIPCSISSHFNPDLNIKLELTRDIDYHGLKMLVRQLTSFLSPVEDNLDMLTFFYLNSSEIFDKYLKHQLNILDSEKSAKSPPASAGSPKILLPLVRIEKPQDPSVVAVDLLGRALDNTREFVIRLIQGNAMYTEIVANGSLNLLEMKIDVEFGILNGYAEWAKIDMQDAEGLSGIQAMLQLFQYAQHIKVIYDVCEQYQLEACLMDGDLKELMQLAHMLDEAETENKLTAKDAIEKMKRVTELLCLGSRQNHRFLELFKAVSESANFHQFIVYEKKFVDEGGRELFNQQYQLITTQLQHEEYQEVVLNHLFAAFKMITPFTQKQLTFGKLMAKVSELNAYDGRRQLDTVNRNINLIRLWFSRAEGDTVQGVASELNCVLETGWFCFHFKSSMDCVSGAVQLRYFPHIYQNVEDARESEPIVWCEEQVEDFVRKLGFLDAEGDSAGQIRHFLHLSQTAKKLLELCTKHRELGHPEYLNNDIKYTLHCTFSQEEADEMVFNAAMSLADWQEMVTSLRCEYEQLLYFTIPKLLHLYQNLIAETPSVGSIVNDVGILFQNKHAVKKQLKKTVKDLVRSKPHLFGIQIQVAITPMHQVGRFLAALFKDSKLSTSSLKQRRNMSPFSRQMSQQSTHILHACQNFTPSQLIRTVIGIFGGVPEPFEVFHCRPTVTEEELRLFLNPTRATKQPFQFLILEVNKLPYHLQETLLRIHYDLKQQQLQGEVDVPCTHFLETGSSLLHEMPWVLHKDYQGLEPDLGFEEASSICKEAALHPEDFQFIQLVYGEAGDGKTHYIENELLKAPFHKKIAVNEAFTPLAAIKKLADLPTDTPNCAVYFNFTLLPPGESVDDQERHRYNHLIDTVGWFFFDLFILGYVEDPVTGHSFRCPGGMAWAIYVEVPSRIKMDSMMCLKEFYEDVPALGLLGTPHGIHPDMPYEADEEVQLVCKYLKAYRAFKNGSSKGINKLFKEGGIMSGRSKAPIKFSTDPDLSFSECYDLLDIYAPPHMKKNKASLKLFIRYMKRRCEFLDNCPAFNFNPGSSEYLKSEKKGKKRMNDTSQLGSTLMETMISEVSDFCDPFIRENWALKPHHQLIYDFKDGGGTFGLLSLHPESIDFSIKEKFMKMGVEIPSMLDLYSRERLDSYLSRALDVPLENNRLAPIDEYKYVLTLDFAIKMLNINERAQCGVPVIIEGETGVGKTALIEMLSRLWNYSLIKNCNLYKDRLLDRIKGRLEALSDACIDSSPNSADALTAVKIGKPLSEEDMIMLGEIKCDGGTQFAGVLREELLEAVGDPMLSMMELRKEDLDPSGVAALPMLVASVKFKNNPKEVAKVLYRLLNCDVKNFFYKLNVHAALLPEQIINFFEPIFNSAKELERAYRKFSHHMKAPFITVFLDEVNTSSCLGLFKEIIVDRTIDGKPIPENIFVIGACNPHRGNSLATVLKKEAWIRGTYYVRQLHPTLQCLMWDYGALGEKQEGEYIAAKMRMSNEYASNSEQANLADLILQSQNLMREYANEQLQDCGFSDSEASECSRSCVSQRDIQRVFTFYEWLFKMYQKYKPVGPDRDYSLRAVLVSLGLVYYLRLDTKYRDRYRRTIDHEVASSKESFTKTFREELNWYIEHIDLPDGIAKTQALKENLFATIVCTMTHTPLIIVGQPGSSKTLSFNLTLSNLKGQESKIAIFRQTEIFKSLDPHFYQCSRHTTSNEIQTVFSRAITRQRSHQRVPLPVYCVVFMDEAGLPEERHESLKVLHFYLDSPEVSFVAISNHVLDAAKTNRAVSLFRPDVTQEDLKILARGCICHTPEKPPVELKRDIAIISNLVPAYEAMMRNEKFSKFFGLRDFIHFISFLKRKRKEMLSPQLVMQALERNFNGMDKKSFDFVTKLFLSHMHADPSEVENTNILDILLNSVLDHPEDSGAENEMRYKLIIDSSEDGLLVRLLFSSGVLIRDKTKIYMCSDFPGDAELQKVNTIAAIRHSATEGHTVIMCQTDSIHESFYDLFNRRFHRIDANTGPRYFSNIAIGAHIKPCRIHEDFECIVVVKESDLNTVPQPFLNRFEKYRLSHDIVLEATLSSMPHALAELLRAVMTKTREFLGSIGRSSSVYGLHRDTVSSLLLTMLPPMSHEYKHNLKMPSEDTPAYEVRNRIMELTLQALKVNAGFLIPECTPAELELDMRESLNQVLRDAEFAGRILCMTSETYYNSTEDIYSAVMEAFDDLHHPHPERDIHQDVSINALLVVSAVTQILVRCLCKRLMQLMTSDSLCLHHRKVPNSYIQNYLNHQNHFSLKKLIEAQKEFLQHKTNANKVICYTRSSQLLHRLPLQYPIPAHQPTDSESVAVLKELVVDDVGELIFQKLSTFTSFTSVNELLKSFIETESKHVLLMTVNMQETSRDVVNHLRVMIEEVEGRAKKDSPRKLFVILLYFPSNKLSVPCYSSLFLQGWDFAYLDMIGFSSQGGALLDIREWFKQCYTKTQFVSTRRSIATQLNALLHEAIPVISSRVLFGKHPLSSFNKPMNASERNKMLKTLFFDKKVGNILCERFHSYWEPSVMVEYLEKAAQLSQQHELSLSVIDSLQNIFKNLFFDFLVHMVYEMNAGMNIDVLFNNDISDDVVQLFLEILRTIPIPKLGEIKMLGITSGNIRLQTDGDSFAAPKFPFFHLIASSVEKMVDQSRRDVNQSLDMLGEHCEPRASLFQTPEQGRIQIMADMLRIIQTKLEDMDKAEEKTFISLTIEALKTSRNLWQKYLEDFTRQKLRLEFGNTGISNKIYHAAFGKLEKRTAIQRLALLHVYVHMHKVNLAKVVSILRPLDQIEVAVANLPSFQSVPVTSPTQSFDIDSGNDDILESSEALSMFIINSLFNAISGIGMSCSSSLNPHVGTQEEQEIKVWFQAYRDMISMPALQEHIYSSRSETAEAQHSIMHALFLLIRSKPSMCSENLQVGLKIFNRLFDDNFKANMELQRKVAPRLGGITTIILEELCDSSSSFGSGTDSAQIRHIVEGLLSHFFSVHLTAYHPDDVRWLLEMANMQTQWQATYLMSTIVEVEYSTDLLSKAEEVEVESSTVMSDASAPHKLFVHIPKSVFKLYLHRILMSSIRARDDPVHSIMLFFQKTDVHTLIADILLSSARVGEEEKRIGPYIPTFYQFCETVSQCPSAENSTMQQPLAHLYFLTVLEDLLTSKFGLPNLIRTSQKIAKACRSASQSEEQLLLLHVEEQAMVQVVIKEVAAHLDMKDTSKINTLSAILEDLNRILDDSSMGGGEIGGHGLVLAMHMLKEQQSFHRFVLLLTDHFSHLCEGINCLQPFNKSLTQASHVPVFRSEVSPFMLELGQEFQTLYQRITSAMSNIQSTHATPAKTKELAKILDECSNSSAVFNVVTSTGRQTTMKRSACFKMALWLAAYNEFFAKGREAPDLANFVSTLTKKVEPMVLDLICCFLHPARMMREKKDEPEQNGQPESPRQALPDPLYHLFFPLAPNQDISDCNLRTSLVHLIAVAIGCGKSTHLWYSIFQPNELINTYISGFMYDSMVGPSTQFYDSGVELTSDGLYGRHDYLKHATRGTLSLHSLYLLLWSNFASFSLSFLTQPEAEKNISGKLLSKMEPAREFCVGQMKKLWILLGTGLGLSEEEKLLLVNSCLNNLLECNLNPKSSSGLSGKLVTRKSLDTYETFWHGIVFTPVWDSLKDKFSTTSPFLKLNVIKDIMNMNLRYPWFPSEQSLSMAILSNSSVADPSGELYPLSKFVLEYPRLKGGMELLPGIVELYQYLHTELTYAITYKEVTTITLKRLAKVISKHFVVNGDRKAHYEKLKSSFNRYVQLTGCTKYKRPVTVGDDTPLVHLLSYSVDGEQGSDLLYAVISDIISFLNKFVSSLVGTLESSEFCRGYFPNATPHVHVMEFTQHYIFTRSTHRRNNLLQLILGRSHLPMAFPTDPSGGSTPFLHSCLPGQLGPLVNLQMLQEDILVTWLAGMPIIDQASVSSLRIPFKFKDDGSSQFSLRDHAYDLETIAEKLPDNFKSNLDEGTRKKFEYEFHSACYHTVMEVLAGLRTSISHLIQEVTATDFDAQKSDLRTKSLPEYLMSLYDYDAQDDSKDVFHEIGVHGVTQTQHDCLAVLSLSQLFSALQLFVTWAEDGWYDFCSLPYGVKLPMDIRDEETISEIPSHYSGSPSQLVDGLKAFADVLIHMETSIVKAATEKSKTPLVRYLKRFQLLASDKVINMFPSSIYLENYVALRVAVRKLTVVLQAEVSRSGIATPEPKEETWCDLVDDLWERYLPYFRIRGYVVTSRPPTSSSFSGDADPSSTILTELTRSDSDQNLLETLKREQAHQKPVPSPPTTKATEEKNLALLIQLTGQVKADEMQRRAKDLTPAGVLEFLDQWDLGRYKEKFEEMDINGELLIVFQDKDLQEIGIESALDRLRIITYFKRLVMKKSSGIAELYPVDAVFQFLNETKPFQQFAATFKEQSIDGELLLNASDDVMKELGVTTGVHRLMLRQKFKAKIDQ